MIININPYDVTGLREAESNMLNKLLEVYNQHSGKNAEKERYYEGKISLNEVNLGIALPDGIKKLEIGCAWGAKTVDVLAARSMFDGFVGADGAEATEMDKIVVRNNLIAEYQKAVRDELKFGCTFATLSRDPSSGCRIRFHSPNSAAALWSGEKGRIACGFAVIDTAPDDDEAGTYQPKLINLHTDTAIWVLRKTGDGWTAEENRHSMGRPLMEPLVWNATSNKPFGRSRIKEPVRRLIQGYVRTIANATIGLEFSTAPQKYLLGITDEQFDAVVSDKFRQYVGAILAATTNPETGEKPSYGQLPQGNIAPHVEMLRILATQFSAATGLSVTDTGVVNDANPTSADAVLAQTQTLVAMAEQMNTGNGNSLRIIAHMAIAITNNVALSDLSEAQLAVVPHFKNPAMPSIAASADAAIKIASTRKEFGGTDVFLEMIGFDAADIRRIRAQERRVRGQQVLSEVEA